MISSPNFNPAWMTPGTPLYNYYYLQHKDDINTKLPKEVEKLVQKEKES